jgi:hypothetical protein
MSKKIWQKIKIAGFLAMGMGMMAGSAQANFGGNIDCGSGGSPNPSCDTWTFNNTKTNTQGGITAAASGWANSTGSANILLESAYVGTWGSSGLGVGDVDEGGINATSPNHAVDNSARTDSVLFTFTDKVNLTSFNAGWVYNDSDFTVLAYTGTSSPASLAGQTYSGLLSNGWSLIGNYSAGTGTGAHDFANGIYSSYWLIGALNAAVGGVNDGKYDYFKILSVAGCDCSKTPNAPGCKPGGGGGVPEPGTLLLMGAGLLGLTRLNMRRAVRNAV